MKRFLALGLCILFLPLTAFAETVDINELRVHTPERLQMTVTTDAGKTVTVDAPITLPEGDTLPVIVVQRATFDKTEIRTVYPLPSFLDRNAIEATVWNDGPGAMYLDLYQEQKNNRISGKVDSTGRASLPQGSTPPENDVTIAEVMAFIQENIRRFHCDTEPDLRVVKATAKSGLYQMKRVKTPEGWTEYAINEKKPVAKAPKGIWHLTLAQYFYGAQVFEHYLPYGSYLRGRPVNPNEWYSPFHFYVDYMDADNFNIGLAPAKQIGLYQEESALLSYQDMVEKLTERIRSGKLKSVCALKLGYSVRIAKGDAFWDLDDQDYTPNTRFVLMPEWQILGFDEKNAADAKFIGLTEPTRDMVLEPETYSRYSLTYELRMDAATGQFVLDYAGQEFDLGDWKP